MAAEAVVAAAAAAASLDETAADGRNYAAEEEAVTATIWPVAARLLVRMAGRLTQVARARRQVVVVEAFERRCWLCTAPIDVGRRQMLRWTSSGRPKLRAMASSSSLDRWRAGWMEAWNLERAGQQQSGLAVH